MAYDVSLKTTAFEVTKKDVVFQVKRNGEMLGRLRVSKGNVEWVPKDFERGYQIKWKEFGELMCKEGSRK
jgi:hypothetical protein